MINSAFRSDAEQAELFAQHPDPTWVAPPGQSLHRCATELDLGPSSAYGWLAAHARSFGFLKRYPWEPWHFGYVDGPGAVLGRGRRGRRLGRRRRQRGVRRRPSGLRPGEVPRRDPARGGELERLRRPARGAAVRRVELQPLRRLARRRRRHRPVHARHRSVLRSRRPVRRRAGDRRPGAPDVRPAEAVRLGPARARRLQRRARQRSRPATASRRIPRPRPTSPGSSACSTARASSLRRCSRSGSSSESEIMPARCRSRTSKSCARCSSRWRA